MGRAVDLVSDAGHTGRLYEDTGLTFAANALGKSPKNLGSRSMSEEGRKYGYYLKRVNYGHE